MKTPKIVDPKKELYSVLNGLFSANYTCLRIAQQSAPKSSDKQVHTANDIFSGKSFKDFWLTDKMQSAAENRNKFIENLSLLTAEFLNEEEITAQFEESKEFFMTLFNKTYKTNKTFEQCFNGFEIIDPRFKRDFDSFDLSAKQMLNGSNLLILYYYQYQVFWEQYSVAKSFIAISQALSSDLTNYGYRSIFYGKPSDPQIQTISRAKLQSLKSRTDLAQATSDELYKKTEKELETLKRKSKNRQEFQSRVTEKRNQLMQVTYLKNKASKLAEFANMLYERLESANSDVNMSSIENFCESALDLASGINIFDKDTNFKVDQVYIHTFERNYLDFLISSYKKCRDLTHQEYPETLPQK